jgi:polyhydroxyalkanoate synthesis regulator phasin
MCVPGGSSVTRSHGWPGERGESLKRHAIVKVASALALGALLAGCGSNAPCPVTENMVETARSNAAEAKQSAQEMMSREQDLESQIQNKRAQIRELEQRKAKIQSELEELESP